MLLNAMQAVESGGTIEIGAALKPSDAQLEIWVEDNGTGIEHDKLDKIFDPFYTTRAKGTGLAVYKVHFSVDDAGSNDPPGVNVGETGQFRSAPVQVTLPTSHQKVC